MKRARGNSPRRRAARSRHLERHEQRVDDFNRQALGSEQRKGEPSGRPIPPCLGCQSISREGRRFLRGCWAPLCVPCWKKRGKPTMAQLGAVAQEQEEKQRVIDEAERQRAVDAGERPW
jgi:hypothetical protein